MGGIGISRHIMAGWRDLQENLGGKAGSESPIVYPLHQDPNLKQTATFFNAVGKNYKAFSVHEKHHPYSLSGIQKAVEIVSGTHRVLRSNQNSIRDEVANLPRPLNGPQGNERQSSIVESVQMIKCGLEKLQQVVELHGYDALNLLSCMTLLCVIKIHFAQCWIMQETLEISRRRSQENDPLSGDLFYKSKVLVSCARTFHVFVDHACFTTLASYTNDTTVRANYERLGTNVWCCSASALCQTRDNNRKSRNPTFLPLPETGATG